MVAHREISGVFQMVTWRDFRLESVQTALFTPDVSSFTSGLAVAAILPKFRDRFDGDMQALPLPADVLPEVPRVSLQSRDGRWRLQIGPARIDSFWSNKPPASPSGLIAIFRQNVEVLDQYVRETSAAVGRVALIVYRVCLIENPAQVLIQRFCNAASQREPFNRSETFEIHNHKVYRPEQGISYPINSWVRCKSASMTPDNRPVILVEQDLNTLAQDLPTRRFTADEMRAFFETASWEADDILGKYFPEQEMP